MAGKTGQHASHGSDSALPQAMRSSMEESGGARLDAGLDSGFEALSLEDHSAGSLASTPPKKKAAIATDHESVAIPKKATFQIGQMTDDADVFATASTQDRRAFTYNPLMVETRSPAEPPSGTGLSESPVSSSRARMNYLDKNGQVDAQAFYPATACVFIANLPEAASDGRLEAVVTNAFKQYGTVFVKIRRDKKNMPFAFAQFMENDAAKRAMVEGKGTIIEGRPCRTEMVKANRSFIIFNKFGRDIHPREAKLQLSPYGPLSKCEPVHPQILEALKLQNGIMIEFENFDPGRDVVSVFKFHPTYTVIAYDLKKSIHSRQATDPDEVFLQRYDAERRSVFVGGLPFEVDDVDLETALRGIMGEVGDVENVQVIRKDARVGYRGPVVFAFVEFSRQDMAELAAQRMNGQTIFSSEIRVERKGTARGGHMAQMPQRMRSQQFMPSEVARSPVHNPIVEGKTREPTTPLRPGANEFAQQGGGGYPGNGGFHVPYGMPPMPTQQMASPVYSASPYGIPAQTSGAGYPATPQATPGVSPYVPGQAYPGNPGYSWAVPYFNDPYLGPLAMYHAFQSPMHVPSPTRAVSEAAPGTPTKSVGGHGHGEKGGEQDE